MPGCGEHAFLYKDGCIPSQGYRNPVTWAAVDTLFMIVSGTDDFCKIDPVLNAVNPESHKSDAEFSHQVGKKVVGKRAGQHFPVLCAVNGNRFPQPEDAESSLGCWSTLGIKNAKFVSIEGKYRLTKGRVDVC